jgi:hypothetical protein
LYGQCRSHRYFRFPLVAHEDDLDEVACCEILELDIPHEDHIKCIIWIRLVLDPDEPIEDYDDVSLMRYRRGCRSKKG